MGYIRKYEKDVFTMASIGDDDKVKKRKGDDVYKMAKNSLAPEIFPSNGMEQRDPDVERLTPTFIDKRTTEFYHERPSKKYRFNVADLYKVVNDKGTTQINLMNPEEKNIDVPANRDWRRKGRPITTHEKITSENKSDFQKFYAPGARWISNSMFSAQPLSTTYYGHTTINEEVKQWPMIIDTEFNVRNNRRVNPQAIEEFNKVAAAGNLTPEQKLTLAGIVNNESEWGATRDLFGINDYGKDFSSEPGKVVPGSYEDKKYREYYTGDPYKDVAEFMKRKTANFTKVDRWNSGYENDKQLNPKGEKYSERIETYKKITMNNPWMMESLFGKDYRKIFKMDDGQPTQ